jgi:hypothetical protein
MNRIVVKSKVDSNGVLHLKVPIGPSGADQEVQVTIEPIGPLPPAPDEWRQGILQTAGKWLGEFVRSEPGEYERRQTLS